MILFTGDLYDMFITQEVLEKCRHVDTVRIKGSDEDVRLFTVDLNT